MHNAYGFFLRKYISNWISDLHVDQNSINAINQSRQENVIIYVLPSASTLEYVLLNFLCLKYGLPLSKFCTDIPFILFQPAWKAVSRGILGLFSWPKSHRAALEEEKHLLREHLERKEDVCIFLKKPGFFKKPELWHVHLWEELVKTQATFSKNVHLVPIMFNWGRSPGKLRTSGLDTLFQGSGLPGNWKKLLLLLKHYQNVEVKFGTPVDLGRFITDLSSNRPDVQAKKLRRLLASYLYRERKILTGPPIRPREKIIQRVLKDVHLQKTIQEHSKRKKLSEEEITHRVRKILQEMIANYKPSLVRLCYYAVRWIQYKLYNQVHVNKEGLEMLKTLAKENSILYLPSHRSHMDYILLSKILFEEGLTPPHIAAGMNLSFFPMGWIFRNTGAFFIRRKISGDLIYARTLASYIRWLIKTGYSQEFFIEGSRTRTGKLLPPKVGLLSSEIEACMEQNTKDLYLIPTAITYDRVPEESEYRSEMLGAKKQKENWKGLLRTKRFLNRKHGNIFIRFGRPISIFQFFESERNEHALPSKDGIHKLAKDVMAEIARQTVVTTTSILCTCILGRNPKKIRLDQLQKDIAYLKSAISDPEQAIVSDENHLLGQQLEHVLNFFVSSRWIEKSPLSVDEYRIRENHRLVLSFHANISLHHFLARNLESLRVLMTSQDKKSEPDLRVVKNILEFEFPYADLETKFDGQASTKSAEENFFFAGLTKTYLETYLIVANAILEQPESDFSAMFKSIQDDREEGTVSYLMAKGAYEYYSQKLSMHQSTIERFGKSLSAVLVRGFGDKF